MERVLLHLAIGAGGGFRAQNLPCSGNGDAALALKPAGCRALRGGDGTFLCLGVWLAEREYSILIPLTFYTPPLTTYFTVIFIPH